VKIKPSFRLPSRGAGIDGAVIRAAGDGAQKVSALREAVVSGSYRPNPEAVAGALFSNMVVKLAA